MPNLETQFKEFLEKISISSSKKESLRTSRDSNRDVIKNYFDETLNKTKPSFHMQGSFVIGTLLNPLEDEEYDLDDGIYLKHLDSDMDNWETTSTVHSWISNALSDITSDGVEDKPPCVRLIYKKNYHIDFTIYGETEDKQYLAHKTEGWIESYPKDFTIWFNDKFKDNKQIQNIAKYLKAWRDFKQTNSVKLPSGMILTILSVNNYIKDDEDQYSLLATTKEIYSRLKLSFDLQRPVKPYENLFDGYSETREKEFLSKLENFIDHAEKATNSESHKEASEEWRKVFGDRFPLAKEPKSTVGSSILGGHGKSA